MSWKCFVFFSWKIRKPFRNFQLLALILIPRSMVALYFFKLGVTCTINIRKAWMETSISKPGCLNFVRWMIYVIPIAIRTCYDVWLSFTNFWTFMFQNGYVDLTLFAMLWAIWYHLHYLKNVKNIYGACRFQHAILLKVSPPWVCFTFFRLYKWYQIAQTASFK